MFVRMISKKQIGVIFANWKKGNLNLTEEQIKYLYNNCAERKFLHRQDHPQLADDIDRVANAIQDIFDGNLEDAQMRLDFVGK